MVDFDCSTNLIRHFGKKNWVSTAEEAPNIIKGTLYVNRNNFTICGFKLVVCPDVAQ